MQSNPAFGPGLLQAASEISGGAQVYFDIIRFCPVHCYGYHHYINHCNFKSESRIYI